MDGWVDDFESNGFLKIVRKQKKQIEDSLQL